MDQESTPLQPTGQHDHRPRLLVCALVVGAALGYPTEVRAQTERARFEVVVQAAEDLVEIDVRTADANGELRRWDRRWGGRLRRMARRSSSIRRCMNPRSCARREVCAIDSAGAALEVRTTRASVLEEYAREQAVPSTIASLASRRLVADEAARRRAERLSCEDLPAVAEVAGFAHGFSDPSVLTAVSGPTEFAELAQRGDHEALLALARGGAAALRALLRERIEAAAVARARRAREAASRCPASGPPEDLVESIAEALRSGPARRHRRIWPLALRAAGLSEADASPTAGTADRDRRRRVREAEQRLLHGDLDVARTFVALVRDEGGDRAAELLAELMRDIYRRISLEDAAVLVSCRTPPS